MKIVQKRIFEGKNIYSHKKCIRIDVDLEGYCEIPSKDIPNFNFNIVKVVPELKLHRCGIDEEGGFLKRLKEGTYLAHICEHIIIALQNRIGINVSYGKAREIKDDMYYIIVQYEYKKTAVDIINLAVDLINALIKQKVIDIDGRMEEIKKLAATEEMGPSTKAICDAAKAYGLPVMEIGESGLYQIGYGKASRIIEATIGNYTKCVSTDIACNKLLTKYMLNIQNIPIAEGYKVYNIIDLLRKSDIMGYPVVLKPQFGNQGKDVILNINNEKELLNAYRTIKNSTEDIIIEKYYKGNDFRVCVVNNNVVAVSQRICPFVVGNNRNSIKELIDIINANPQRGEDHEKPLTKIKIDAELLRVLRCQNLSLDYCPKENEKVILRDNANLSTGGIAIDCTDKICDENIEYCIRAAKTIGLDICGIDICTEDISKSIENNGIIIEVNAAPGIRMHEYPNIGQKRNVGKAIVDMMYNGKPANIPVISVTGTNGKTTTSRLISYTLRTLGYNVGMTSTQGIYINDLCIHNGDDSGFKSAKTILMNKDVDVAVLETARGGMIKNGLAYDSADIAVITNITNDHLGLDGINSMEELSFVKSLVGEEVKKNGFVIVNADDDYSKKIINRINSEKIYFSKSKNNCLIRDNIEQGKIAVFLENDKIKVVNNHREYDIIDNKDLPISYNNILDYNLENAMAACGALVGLKIDYCVITRAFTNFKLDSEHNCGRFNVYEYDGRKIILDYGHNIEGYRKVLNSISKIKNRNRLIGVIGVPGDRQNIIINQIGDLCAQKLNNIIIKEDKDRRGRRKGEVAEILYKAVCKSDKYKKPTICLDEVDALKQAVNISCPGDIIIVFYEKIEPLIDVIKKYMQSDNFQVSTTNMLKQ